jgi:hypothetical protein
MRVSSIIFFRHSAVIISVHNINAVSDNKYYIIGKMIATSIIQGGQPPLCFSAAVADFLVYDCQIETLHSRYSRQACVWSHEWGMLCHDNINFRNLRNCAIILKAFMAVPGRNQRLFLINFDHFFLYSKHKSRMLAPWTFKFGLEMQQSLQNKYLKFGTKRSNLLKIN